MKEEKTNNAYAYISIVAIVAIVAVFVIFAGNGSKQTSQPIVLSGGDIGADIIGDARARDGIISNFQQFDCNPGQMVGDLNNDGKIDVRDIIKMNKIISGEINMPRNLCCVDITGNGRVTTEDVKVLTDLFMSGNPRPRYCSGVNIGSDFSGDTRARTIDGGISNFQQFDCKPGQMVGDLNNDGVVNALDITKMNKIISGEINMPRNICCVDITGNGRVTTEDVKVLAELFVSGNPRPRYCSQHTLYR